MVNDCIRKEVHTDKSFLNLFNPNQIWIVITLLRFFNKIRSKLSAFILNVEHRDSDRGRARFYIYMETLLYFCTFCCYIFVIFFGFCYICFLLYCYILYIFFSIFLYIFLLLYFWIILHSVIHLKLFHKNRM